MLIPDYEDTGIDSEYALLIDEAAQFRRKVLRHYVLKFYMEADEMHLKMPVVPEPFGDAMAFI